jgi:hypothetical protein
MPILHRNAVKNISNPDPSSIVKKKVGGSEAKLLTSWLQDKDYFYKPFSKLNIGGEGKYVPCL